MAKTPAKTPKDRPAYKKVKSVRLPVNKLHPVKKLIKVDDSIVEARKLTELAELLWLPGALDKEERNARIVRAVELYESLKPADGAESMLAAQIVGTYTAALECLRRAAISEQTFAGRDMALKHAQKLMTLYAKQLETLNKHRGKGQQKVTVEHVNVAAGGQAIVGNVDTEGWTSITSLAAIEHSPEIPLAKAVPAKKAKLKIPREWLVHTHAVRLRCAQVRVVVLKHGRERNVSRQQYPVNNVAGCMVVPRGLVRRPATRMLSSTVFTPLRQIRFASIFGS